MSCSQQELLFQVILIVKGLLIVYVSKKATGWGLDVWLRIEIRLQCNTLELRDAEAQKPGWQGGIAIRKVFARLESFRA